MSRAAIGYGRLDFLRKPVHRDARCCLVRRWSLCRRFGLALQERHFCAVSRPRCGAAQECDDDRLDRGADAAQRGCAAAAAQIASLILAGHWPMLGEVTGALVSGMEERLALVAGGLNF